ncbi:MAG: hypothetical protein H7337_10830 [Rhizobacter sp.]|nr:hypothetical protein [Rhizobacter sp.]
MSLPLPLPLSVLRHLLAVIVATSMFDVHAVPVALDDAKAASGDEVSVLKSSEPPAGTASSSGRSAARRIAYDTVSRPTSASHDIDDLDYATSAAQMIGPRTTAAGKGNAQPSSAASGPAASGASNEPATLARLATSVSKWVHDAMPWKHPENAGGAEPDGAGSIDSAGFSDSGAAGQRGARPVSGDADYDKDAGGARYDRPRDPYDDNPLRQAIKMWRSFLTHPLTWLVIVLIGAGFVVVSIVGRRRK